jgi:hypothetical protein
MLRVIGYNNAISLLYGLSKQDAATLHTLDTILDLSVQLL